MFDIENHKKEILAVGYENKKIENKDKWNQLNLLDTQSLLGANHHMPLSHMAKSYIWIEEKNQIINEFSIGYMVNPNLYKRKSFRDQVKGCFKNKFGPYTNTHIGKILFRHPMSTFEYDNRFTVL